MPTVDLSLLGTIVGDAAFASIATQLVMQAWQPSDEAANRFGPLIATAWGVVGALVAAWYVGAAGPQAYANAAFMGLVAGGYAIAVHAYSTKSAISDVMVAILRMLGITIAAPTITGTSLVITSSGPKAAGQ